MWGMVIDVAQHFVFIYFITSSLNIYILRAYVMISEAQAIAPHEGIYMPEGRPVAHMEGPLLLLHLFDEPLK